MASVGASTAHPYSGGTTETTSPITTQVAGSGFLVFVAGENSLSGLAVTDNKGNSYQQIGTPQGGFSSYASFRSAVFLCPAGTGGAGHTFSATTSSTSFASVFALELLDLGDSPLDVFVQAMDEATPFTLTSPATAEAGELLVLCAGTLGGGALVESTGFTKHVEITDASYWTGGLLTRTADTAGVYTPSLTGPNGASMHLVALKSAGGSAGTVVEATGTAAGTASVSGVGEDAQPTGGTTGEGAGAVAGVSTVEGQAATVAASTGTSAPQQGAPSLGAHTLAWSRISQGVNPHVSDPITTQDGSVLLVVVANGNLNIATPTDNKGNTFAQVGSRLNYTRWGTFGVSAYLATDIVGGAGHTVSIQKDGQPNDEISMFVAEIRNADALQDFSLTEVLEPDDLVSGAVTTTEPALLLAYWFGDGYTGPHTAVARDGYTPLEGVYEDGELIQCSAAVKAEPEAGTYSVGWDESPEQGAILGVYAFQGSGASESVTGQSQTLLAATGGAQGVAAAAGAGGAIATATGAAAGGSTVQGVTPVEAGTATEAQGSAAGTSTAQGAAGAIAATEGTTGATAEVSGVSGRIAGSTGDAEGSSQVSGRTTDTTPPVRTRWSRTPPHRKRHGTPTDHWPG